MSYKKRSPVKELYLSIKNNMMDRLNRYYISDISQMIFNYIENDCIEKKLKKISDKQIKLNTQEDQLNILKNNINLCNFIASSINKKIVVMLKRWNGKITTKTQKLNIKFLKQMIKKKNKNTTIQYGKLCGMTDDQDGFAFGDNYYKEVKDLSLVSDEKHKLKVLNEGYNPSYNNEMLDACINGVFIHKFCVIIPSHLQPIILIENMERDTDYMNLQPIKYYGNRTVFLFKCLLIEKK